ncbi:hypothetical protein B0H10DRAFT_359241 [Mycena sp. CBHHK59/15]|nr:hypothetical protein B0H10DRAFT_359241 [Mycena sp. CBHHK59/15]
MKQGPTTCSRAFKLSPIRRDAQRSRRARENSSDRELRRKDNTTARRTARNTAEVQSSNSSEHWWVRMAQLNSSETKLSLGLHWNRTCKHCGIKVLAGERCHDRCFVCGPKGSHYLPLPPPYPEEWETFIHDRKTSSLSRKFNQLFSLTALGVHDGDFMHFSPGVSAVTLNGGRTYHRILPAYEGQHAIRWFIHDPHAIFAKGDDLQIPRECPADIDSQ